MPDGALPSSVVNVGARQPVFAASNVKRKYALGEIRHCEERRENLNCYVRK
jgi:hypothetical protein